MSRERGFARAGAIASIRYYHCASASDGSMAEAHATLRQGTEMCPALRRAHRFQ
jgi:hypothetical protein